VAGIVRQVAGALRSAHLMGIVHRDIKPENVMVLSGEGEPDFVKVLDFGVSNVSRARRRHRAPRRNRRGAPSPMEKMIVGTPGYMPPEQLQQAEVDDRADQFSLAAVAWELLAGRPAFLADDDGALLWQILNDQPPPLGRFVDLPPAQLAEVEAVLARGLSKDRNQRYPDILEFARALDGVLVSASGELPQLRRAPVSSPSLPALPVVSAPLDEFAGVGQSYLW
jgi:serine/threonine-protein kinase